MDRGPRTDNDAAKQKPLRWKLFNEAFVSRTKPLTISCLLGMPVSQPVRPSVCLSACPSVRLCVSFSAVPHWKETLAGALAQLMYYYGPAVAAL